MEEKEKRELLCLAESAAYLAGKHLKEKREEWRDIQGDSGHDVKISADWKSEELIVEHLKKHSSVAIFSEESGWVSGRASTENNGNLRWIVDPLDGSFNYRQDIPWSCVSIALYEGNNPVLGVVYDFNHEELFKGVIGEGAWLNNKPIYSSQTEDISKAVLGTGFPVKADFSTSVVLKFIEEIQQFRKVRLLGSAALSLCYVACGRMDVYKENNIMLWDIAAGVALVHAAGGKIQMHYGENLSCPLTVIASNGTGII